MEKWCNDWTIELAANEKHFVIPNIITQEEFNWIINMKEEVLILRIKYNLSTFKIAQYALIWTCFLLGQDLQAAFTNVKMNGLIWKIWFESLPLFRSLSLSYAN